MRVMLYMDPITATQLTRRSLIGARADDPVLPEKKPRPRLRRRGTS